MAAKCEAIKANGMTCNANAKFIKPFGTLCLRHFNLKFSKDKDFREDVKKHDPKLYDTILEDSEEEKDNKISHILAISKKSIKTDEKKIILTDVNQKALDEFISKIDFSKDSKIQYQYFIKEIGNKITYKFIKYEENILRIQKEKEEAERKRLEELLIQREEAERARIAALNAANAHRGITLVRDPKDSIDLKAFGSDQQSIHRSSVQSETEKGIIVLMKRSVPIEQNTLEEIIQLFVEPKNFKWANEEHCLNAIDEITKDYHSCISFGYKYSDVCDRVWAFMKEINMKDPTNQINLRFASEILEGKGMCANGKMAHLINVLQGYDTEMDIPTKSREIFQHKMTTLLKLPMDERKVEAMKLFEEFEIPKDEHSVWLDVVLDED